MCPMGQWDMVCQAGQWAVPLEFDGKLQGTNNMCSKTLWFINNIMSCVYIMHYIFTCTCFSLVNESLTCHPQCDSVTSCWGPSDTQCEECRNFRYLRRCVQNCSVVSLPTNSRWGSCDSEGRSCESEGHVRVRVMWEWGCVRVRLCESEVVWEWGGW